MAVTWCEIRNLRAVEETRLVPAPGMNLLLGENGSGKTSLLEALYLLSAGRSFTTVQLENVVRRGAGALEVVAGIEDAGTQAVLGVRRKVGAAPDIHLNGEKVDGFARLAERLPAQVIYPQSDELISGGPANRRRFLDWGVFHVEHDFMACWREYQRALTQRNAVLRAGGQPKELTPWDRVLARAGEQLAGYRAQYVDRLMPYITGAGETLFEQASLELEMNRGWSEDMPLGEALVTGLDRDRRTGTTNAGPHRAELKIQFAGADARATASRGQQKMAVYALKLAQINYLWDARQRRTLLLLDDLPSELDRHSRARVFQALRKITGQIFVTAIERAQVDAVLVDFPAKLFHVEQGGVTELVY